MNKTTLIFLTLIFLLAVILGLPEWLAAQAPPPPPVKPQQAPIDGGLGLLAAAGGAYAIKKLRDKKHA